MQDCIFCKIIKGEIPSKKVYENDAVLAIRDIEPQAPTHVLLMPKAHIQSIHANEAAAAAAELTRAIRRVAEIEQIDSTGYRVISNVGKHANQTVEHFHIHILGGKNLGVSLTDSALDT